MTSYEFPPVRLSRISLRNVRCFEDLDINLETPGGQRNWAVIFGDNGVGKTTLLRSIAVGLCDEASAAGLLREIYGDWNRIVGKEHLEAQIELTFSTATGPASIRTTIEPRGSGYTRVRQDTSFSRDGEEFPWDAIFACGYGAARRSFGTKDISEYATIDAVYTLFNYDTPLQNPELVLRRYANAAGENGIANAAVEGLLDSIARTLMLPPGSIKLGAAGLVLSGPWGEFQPIGGVGDGFQATLAWITDFLGWAVLYDPERSLENVSGIVLIDEIEQHLHPRWQRQIIKLLRDQFPNVQFIATTHTPMCAVGTTDLQDEECELIKLERRGSRVIAIEDLVPPRGQRADQVLTSLLFDMPTSGDNLTLGKIARLNQLAIIQTPAEEEKNELAGLRSELRTQFSAEESKFETIIRDQVRKALAEQRRADIDLEAADFEVLRTLRDMSSDEEDRVYGAGQP